jgi:cytochrome c
MKLLICICTISLFLVSCGEKKTDQPATEAVAEPKDAIKEGELLVAQNDCKTCHHKVNKIVGPGHTDVAKKYEFTEANVKLLAEHIMKGSVGVWGQIPMNSHPDLSVEDAQKMARYVLALDGEKEH